MSCCNMMVNGPNKARSKFGSVAGEPATINLGRFRTRVPSAIRQISIPH